jgi:hypothetical protein
MSEMPPPKAAKTKRKPPQFCPLSPHGVRITIVQRLVNPASLKQKGAWGRELQILKRLQLRYPDDTFFLTLSPAEQVDSLTYFVAPFGAAQLQREWNLYQFSRAQDRQIAVDMESMPRIMEDTPADSLPALKPKETAVGWSDSA